MVSISERTPTRRIVKKSGMSFDRRRQQRAIMLASNGRPAALSQKVAAELRLRKHAELRHDIPEDAGDGAGAGHGGKVW